MSNLKKFIPFLLIALVFAIGGYFVGNIGNSSQEASIYSATPVRIGNYYSVDINLGNGRCAKGTYQDDGTPMNIYFGVWRGAGGCVLLFPNANGEIPYQGVGIYAKGSTNSNNIKDNGDGTCTVKFADGRQSKGKSLYGTWNNQLKQYFFSDSATGVFVACDTAAILPGIKNPSTGPGPIVKPSTPTPTVITPQTSTSRTQ